jgi:hypothetical protein
MFFSAFSWPITLTKSAMCTRWAAIYVRSEDTLLKLMATLPGATEQQFLLVTAILGRSA